MSATHAGSGEATAERRQPIAFWGKVEVGDAVRLQKADWPPHEGYVDDKTPDGDIVWISSVGERRVFHKADGYSLMVRG